MALPSCNFVDFSSFVISSEGAAVIEKSRTMFVDRVIANNLLHKQDLKSLHFAQNDRTPFANLIVNYWILI